MKFSSFEVFFKNISDQKWFLRSEVIKVKGLFGLLLWNFCEKYLWTYRESFILLKLRTQTNKYAKHTHKQTHTPTLCTLHYILPNRKKNSPSWGKMIYHDRRKYLAQKLISPVFMYKISLNFKVSFNAKPFLLIIIFGEKKLDMIYWKSGKAFKHQNWPKIIC